MKSKTIEMRILIINPLVQDQVNPVDQLQGFPQKKASVFSFKIEICFLATYSVVTIGNNWKENFRTGVFLVNPVHFFIEQIQAARAPFIF